MRVLLRADWVVTPELDVLQNGFVVIDGGLVREFSRREPEGRFDRKVYYRGVVFPPFVNAHTHLELSWLNFSPGKFSDFFEWLLWIIGSRQLFTQEFLKKGFEKGLSEIEKYGIVYVGDISSFGLSKRISRFGLISFQEVIGKDINVKELSPPLSIHSIYSVSFELMKKVALDSRERGYFFQIHLAEVSDEVAFSRCEENRFESIIYPFVGRKRYDNVCADGVISYLDKAGALFENTIAVHCVNLNRRELEILVERGSSVVLCPRSNIHLKVGLPDFEFLLDYDKVGIGTDGLSSNTSLSIFEELRAIYYVLEGRVSLRRLLELATSGGAKVLGIEDYGKRAVFTAVPFDDKLETPFDLLLFEGLTFEILDFSSPL